MGRQGAPGLEEAALDIEKLTGKKTDSRILATAQGLQPYLGRLALHLAKNGRATILQRWCSKTSTPSPNAGTNSGSGTNSNNPPETPASPTPDRPSPEEIAQLRAQEQRDRDFLTSFNIAGTSARRREVTAAYEAWISDVTPQLEAGGWDGAVEAVTVRVPTSRETCLARQQLQASYGVLVDRDGDRVGEPRLIMSSGFALLNRRALEAVQNKDDFENETDQNRPFRVDVIFQYNTADCPPIDASTPPAS
ncbi:MAG: hypothetical protein HC895_02055 [Leptolyngbyaceae cyanobacterium SM1_3_5]|nr:hypothetical protein [Leptolyngbyaceae cyanobacterium SM1_3_5]